MTSSNGLVIKAQSGFFTVQTRSGLIVCRIPGRLKEEHQRNIELDPDYPRSDIVAVGDWVDVVDLGDGTGEIESVAERKRALIRSAPPSGGRAARVSENMYKQIIIANPDQAVFVFSISEPEPSPRMLDRFLVMAEDAEIPSVICINKIDIAIELGFPEYPRELFGLYSEIGYPVIYTSAATGEGVDGLRDLLLGKISVLAGPSGVGKSSLLNTIQPGLGLAITNVSQATGRGKHTTRVRELIPLDGGGYVADTPGLRTMALWDIEPEELDAYFREIAPLVADCAFSDCSHTNEPGCAVLEAVDRGLIHPERYDSYLRLRDEASEKPWWY